MHFLAQMFGNFNPEWIPAAVAILGIWARIEHRITRLEAKIEDKLK